MAGGIFLRTAHIEQIKRALTSLTLEAGQHRVVDMPDAETLGDIVGQGTGLRQALG